MSDRTEEATPKKLKDAAARGELPKSRDFTASLVIAAVAYALVNLATLTHGVFSRGLRATLERVASGPQGSDSFVWILYWAFAMFPVVVWLWAVWIAAAVIGNLLQNPPSWSTKRWAFSWDKLNPVTGVKNLVNKNTLIEIGKQLFKASVLAWLIIDALRLTLSTVSVNPSHTFAASLQISGMLLKQAVTLLLVLGVLDVFLQRWLFKARQRMTKEEVKREHKEQDGDPHAKQERERARHEILQHSALEDMRKASVLIVNPTHLAIALQFDAEDESQGAPVVLARGQEELAQKMIAVAVAEGIPIVLDVPIARELFPLEVGHEIPPKLYEAVAAIIGALDD